MKPIPLDPKRRQERQRRRHQSRDKRLDERLSAVLWIADGKTRCEVADLLGGSVRQLAEWLRLFRHRGLDALCTLHHPGDPGNLTAAQVERLQREISTGRFRNADQIRLWVEEGFGVSYTPSGLKGLLRRIGASYHQVTGFLWKADPDKQHEFVTHYERQKAAAQRPGASRTRGYFVDACHPLWGLELVDACRLLVGPRFLAGRGSGRKRLNILGAYCPDDQEYLDLRLTPAVSAADVLVSRPWRAGLASGPHHEHAPPHQQARHDRAEQQRQTQGLADPRLVLVQRADDH
jgi:transposase